MTAPKNMPLTDLGLPPSLLKKLDPIVDLNGLRTLRVEVLAAEWKLTEKQHERIQSALTSRGLAPLDEYVIPERPSRKRSDRGKCKKRIAEDGSALPADHGPSEGVACGLDHHHGKRSCSYHWLLSQPVEDAIRVLDAAAARRPSEGEPGHRARVPESDWPAGRRWCSDCQTFVPLFFCRGAKCIPHASKAAHASMTKRVYDFTRSDYENLLAWQRGRCYICQQLPRVRRLAVDHDHVTGRVRGLLCANDEWGCNATLARLLNSPGMARRALEYVTRSPVDRMQADEDSPVIEAHQGRARPAPGPRPARARLAPEPARAPAPPRQDDPFEGFLS